MASIKVKLKIGEHKQETEIVDLSSYDEEKEIYREFYKAYLKFKNDLKEFRYSPESPHHKTSIIEGLFSEEKVSWPELKNRWRTLLVENLQQFYETGEMQLLGVRKIYREEYGELPKYAPQALNDVINEFINKGILLKGETRGVYAVLTQTV
jgi:hypothetical protein